MVSFYFILFYFIYFIAVSEAALRAMTLGVLILRETVSVIYREAFVMQILRR